MIQPINVRLPIRPDSDLDVSHVGGNVESAQGNAPPPPETGGPLQTATVTTAANARLAHRSDLRLQQMRMALENDVGSRRLVEEGFDFSGSQGSGLTFNGTAEDDSYLVTQDAAGRLTVTNQTSGATHRASAARAQGGLTIRAGGGDDAVTIDDSVRISVDVRGGAGDDTIDGSGARGPLSIFGEGGDDVLRGGRGHDVIAGGDGNDTIDGGAGDDQLRGDGGGDVVDGGLGSDFVDGGQGADRIYGGLGADVVYGDAADLQISGARIVGTDQQNDAIVAERGSVTPTMAGRDSFRTYDPEQTRAWLSDHPEFEVQGDAFFRRRVEADIGVLLGTRQGKGLLRDLGNILEANGDRLILSEEMGDDLGRYTDEELRATSTNLARQNPHDASLFAPTAVLFHELVHAYQFQTQPPVGGTQLDSGRVVSNIELQATGLPYYDEFNRLQPANNIPYTDNLFREEIGLRQRRTYGGPISPPARFVP